MIAGAPFNSKSISKPSKWYHLGGGMMGDDTDVLGGFRASPYQLLAKYQHF